jgi:hypothetical protein
MFVSLWRTNATINVVTLGCTVLKPGKPWHPWSDRCSRAPPRCANPVLDSTSATRALRRVLPHSSLRPPNRRDAGEHPGCLRAL